MIRGMGQSERDRAFGQAWCDGLVHGMENADPMPLRLRESITIARDLIDAPPPYRPDLSLIAEQETDLRPRGTAAGLVADLEKAAEHFRNRNRMPVGVPLIFDPPLILGAVKVEPWRWWMRFVPGRPRAVNYLRSFPPGPTQDEDARAWWESLR